MRFSLDFGTGFYHYTLGNCRTGSRQCLLIETLWGELLDIWVAPCEKSAFQKTKIPLWKPHFKENVSDIRNSQSLEVFKKLQEKNINITEELINNGIKSAKNWPSFLTHNHIIHSSDIEEETQLVKDYFEINKIFRNNRI